MPRYKYSGTRTKLHPKGDFRTQKPKLVKTTKGYQWIQVCDEWIGGRWEGFVSNRSGKYPTRLMAQLHPPKW